MTDPTTGMLTVKCPDCGYVNQVPEWSLRVGDMVTNTPTVYIKCGECGVRRRHVWHNASLTRRADEETTERLPLFTEECPKCQCKKVLTRDEIMSDDGRRTDRRLACLFCGYMWDTTQIHCGGNMNARWASEVVDRHRTALRAAVRSLPEKVMCEDVARELVTRNDLSVSSLRVLYRVVAMLHQEAVLAQERDEERAKK